MYRLEGKNHVRSGKASEVESNKEAKLFDNFELDRILTTREVAEYLRTSPKQIRKWVYQGKIKSFKPIGRCLRFRESDLSLLIKGG
jgi:excisionase family DNA binding protein